MPSADIEVGCYHAVRRPQSDDLYFLHSEKQLIKANIESQMVWEGNLVELREFTTWNVVISPENRRVAFEKV